VENTEFTYTEKSTYMSCWQFKTMLVCFFSHKGIVHYEFIAEGQTMNQQCHLEVLARLRESVWRKRPELWPEKWILCHDNASAHDASRVREFLAKKSITKMDHSPDLAPCDFWLFPKLKNALQGQRFADILTSNEHDATTRYSRKRFSGLFPAVAPSYHEVHSFTRIVFQR
jgi:hypothetical protein